MNKKDIVKELAKFIAKLIRDTDKLSWSTSALTIAQGYKQAKNLKTPMSFEKKFIKFFIIEYWERIKKLKDGQVLHVHSQDTSFESVLMKSGLHKAAYPPYLYFQVWGDGAILIKRGMVMDWRLFWRHEECEVCLYRVLLPINAEERIENCEVEQGIFVSPFPISGMEADGVFDGEELILEEIRGYFGFGETQQRAFDRACVEKWESDESISKLTGGYL